MRCIVIDHRLELPQEDGSTVIYPAGWTGEVSGEIADGIVASSAGRIDEDREAAIVGATDIWFAEASAALSGGVPVVFGAEDLARLTDGSHGALIGADGALEVIALDEISSRDVNPLRVLLPAVLLAESSAEAAPLAMLDAEDLAQLVDGAHGLLVRLDGAEVVAIDELLSGGLEPDAILLTASVTESAEDHPVEDGASASGATGDTPPTVEDGTAPAGAVPPADGVGTEGAATPPAEADAAPPPAGDVPGDTASATGRKSRSKA